MKNLITITIEVEGDVPLMAGKTGHALNMLKDRMADYIHGAYLSVMGPMGITFELPQGGDADEGDDALVRVNIKEVD